jgi:hypothetical protein
VGFTDGAQAFKIWFKHDKNIIHETLKDDLETVKDYAVPVQRSLLVVLR